MIGQALQIINWLYKQPKEKIYEIKEKVDKRSLNANSYFYVLQNKLADALGVSNEELHLELLKRYSNVVLITLPKDKDIQGFIKYYDIYKTGLIKGQAVIQYKVYQPSSEMDSKDFTRLLDGLISECKEVGINTMTPQELEQLKGYEKRR